MRFLKPGSLLIFAVSRFSTAISGSSPTQRPRPQRNHLPINLELIVVKTVFLVPQTGAAERIHRVSDADEMLEEFRCHVFVNRIGLRQFKRHGKHREAVETHPGCAVRLLQKSSGRQRLRSVEHADVIEPEETAGEKIVAFRVFAIHPPGES